MNSLNVPPRLVAALVLLPCIGLFLLMPPVVQLFALDVDLGGVPLIVVYLFGVWLGLIGCAAWLAWRVSRHLDRIDNANRADSASRVDRGNRADHGDAGARGG